MSLGRIEEARELAAAVHSKQKYGDEDYIYHLDKVFDVLHGFPLIWRYGDYILVAAYLHDSIEDTTLKYSQIKERFGEEVANLVWAVTDEQGRNRKERKIKTLPKLIGFEDAIALKLADIIANVEYSKLKGNNFWKMYKKEFPVIKYFLYEKDTKVEEMWQHLATLLGE